MNIPKNDNHTDTAKKLISLVAPITLFYFLYQEYANTHTYVGYLDLYVKQAVAVLNNWFGETVEFQRGILGNQEAAIVSQTDFNYVFMNTDQDPLFVLVLLLSVILTWPSSWTSKIVGSLLSIALIFAAVVAALVGLFFWATHYPLGYAEVKEWVTGVVLFATAFVIILFYIGLAGRKSRE